MPIILGTYCHWMKLGCIWTSALLYWLSPIPSFYYESLLGRTKIDTVWTTTLWLTMNDKATHLIFSSLHIVKDCLFYTPKTCIGRVNYQGSKLACRQHCFRGKPKCRYFSADCALAQIIIWELTVAWINCYLVHISLWRIQLFPQVMASHTCLGAACLMGDGPWLAL